MGTLFKALMTVTIATTLLSCTRPEDAPTKVSISLPQITANSKKSNKSQSLGADYSAMSVTLKHVLINVTGSGLNRINIAWSANEPNAICSGVVCSFDVPSGSGRTFQVLAVYDEDGVMKFYYGDTVADISGTAVGLNISVTSVSTAGVTPVETSIYGRYLTSASDGPSGPVEMRLHPGSKPYMVLGVSEMVRGWVNLFGLTGVKFDYVLANSGTSLFGGPKSVDELISTSSSSQLLVKWPTYWQNNNSVAVQRQSEQSWYAFFGPGVTGTHKVCYATGTGSVSSKYTAGDLATQISYNPSGGATDVRVDVTGRSGGSNSCTASSSAPMASSELYVDPKNGDFQIRPPFGKNSSGSELSLSGSALSVTMAPDVAAADINSLHAFWVPETSLDSMYRIPGPGDAYQCNRISADSSIATSGILTAGSSSFTGTNPVSITISPTSASGKRLIVCPKRDAANFMNAAAQYWSGGGGGGPYLMLNAEDSTATRNGNDLLTTMNVCHPVKFQLYNSGTFYSYPTSGGLTINLPAGFYDSSSCTNPKTSVTIAQFSSSSTTLTLYFKGTSLQSATALSLTTSDASVSTSSNTITVANPKLKIEGLPAKLIQNVCYPAQMRAMLANGSDYVTTPTRTVNFTVGTPYSYAGSDNTCTTGSGSANIVTSSAIGNVYIKANTLSGGANLPYSLAGYDATTASAQVVAGSNQVNRIEITAESPPLKTGVCSAMVATLVNENGGAVNAVNPVSFKLAIDPAQGAAYGIDSSCSGAPSNTVTIPALFNYTKFYFRGHLTGNILVRVTDSIYPVSTVASARPSLYDMDLTTTAPVATDNYIYPTLSAFSNRTLVGSHEFTDLGNTAKLIPLNVPAGTTFSCSPSGTGYTSGNCTGFIDGSNNFVWTLSNALNPSYSFYIQANSSAGTSTFKFKANDLWGSDFKVMNCGTTVTANTSDPSITGTSPVICVAPGVALTLTTQNSISNGAYLIGAADGTSTLNTTSVGSGSALYFTGLGSGSAVANFNFPSTVTAVTEIDVNISTNPGSAVELAITGNLFSSVSGKAIRLSAPHSNTSVRVLKNAFTFVPATGAPIGILMTAMKNLFAISNKFIYTSFSNSTHAFIGIQLDSSGTVASDNIHIEDMNWMGSGLSRGVYINAPSGYPATNVYIENSKFKSTNATTLNTRPIDVSNTDSFYVRNNVVRDQANDPSTGSRFLLSLSHQTSIVKSGVVSGNIFNFGTQGSGSGILFLQGNSSPSTEIYISDFSNNQFVSTTSAAVDISTNYPAISSITTANRLDASTSTGNNKFCSASSYIWTSVVEGTSLSGTSTWSLTATDSSNRQANTVSSEGFCKF